MEVVGERKGLMEIDPTLAYPILRAAARKKDDFDAAIKKMTSAKEAGSIRKMEYDLAKSVLSRAAEMAWETHVREPFFCGGRYADQDVATQDLNNRITILSLHDVIATTKKVAACDFDNPAIRAMREFCDEAAPLAHLVASLKSVVVAGRAPRAENATDDAGPAELGTCPVCFRSIGVVRQKMAHHGYHRPQIGFQTSSCPGIRFCPLEASSDGLAWFIGSLRSQLQKDRDRYAQRDEWTTLTRLARVPGVGRRTQLITTRRGDPEWQKEFDIRARQLEHEIRVTERHLAELEPVLADWKPGQTRKKSNAASEA